MDSAADVIDDLNSLADPVKAGFFPRFFKTGIGQYGQGDQFIGVTVPKARIIAHKYLNLSYSEIEKLIQNPIHECRLTALLILTLKYKKADELTKKLIVNFYLDSTKYINNWDLVDLSAANILGRYLLNRNKDILYKLCKSLCLWERRIAIISTFWFIHEYKFDDALRIAELLISDKHDLIHKAVGWMLREIGKRNLSNEEEFLKKYYKVMPRTMLRYAIEKFPPNKYYFYLNKSKRKTI
jgi:3-methyladenine DNA glycosylase AlkD